ncbi:MAG: FG-GAP-like repeat-containing protein [Burkholderiales bacterium]
MSVLCALPAAERDRVLARAAERKPGFDQPDRALQYRIDSMRGDDGKVAPDGPYLAQMQRRRVLATVTPKLGGLTGGQPFWSTLGPGNVGGRVRAILPLSPTRVLIGSVSGGLWLTENAGASWTAVMPTMPNVAISCLIADPADASIVYVCTGEGPYPFDAIPGDGIYRITGADLAPASWSIARVSGTTPLNASSPWFWVNRLVVLDNPAHPADTAQRILVAATRNGLFRSTDGGANFVRVATETEVGFAAGRRYMDVRSHPLAPANLVAGEMFTAGEGGAVAASFDGGVTWVRVALAGSERVEVTPVSGVAGAWLALAGYNGGQLYRSADGGATWTRRDTSGLDNATPSTGGIMGTQAWYDEAVWASPDGTRVLAGGVDIRFSIDGGTTFAKITSGTHSDHHAIVPATDGATTGTVYFGNDGGVYKANGVNAIATATPGPVFASLNNNLPITQFYGAAALGSFVTGGTQDNGTKSYDCTRWFGTFGGDGGRSAIDPTDAKYVYGSAQNGALFRSTDGGNTASYICTGNAGVGGISEAGGCPYASTSGTLFVAPFALDGHDPNRMFFGGQKVWRSTNVKASVPTWAAVRGTQVAQTNPYVVRISTVAIRPGTSDVVWVGYEDGQVWRTADATATAPTWERVVFNGVSNPLRQVMRILFDPVDVNRVFVALGGYQTGNVLVTHNAGAAGSALAWTDVHGNLPAAPVRTLVLHPQVPDYLYAGTDVGVFASETAGVTWSTSDEGPGTVAVEDLVFTDPGTLVAATHGRGMFRATLALPTAAGSVQFTQSAQNVSEGGVATFTVTRIGGAHGAASASYAAVDGTATGGVDYGATSGTLNWADGDASSRQITIPIANDNATEGVESFRLAITGSTGVMTGYPASVAVNIFDPDAFPPHGQLPTGWVQPTTSAVNPAVSDYLITRGFVVDSNPANAYEGMQSMHTGDLTGLNYVKAAIEGVETTGAGNVTFAALVPNADCLEFYVDHVLAGSWCNFKLAVVNGIYMDVYGDVSVPVAAGTHTFRWQYYRSGGAEPYRNGAWVDGIRFPPSGLEPVFTSPAAVEFTIGSAGSFTVTAGGTPAPALSLGTALPAGLTFHPASGTLDGTPAVGTAGSYVLALTAANGHYPDASQYVALTIAKGAQAITFDPLPDRSFGAAPFGLIASGGGSGNAVSFAASPPEVCTVAGATVTLVGVGTCAITADQAGNGDYQPAPQVGRSFAVGKGAQTIVFNALPDRIYGDPAFTVGATGGGSGNPVTFSASTAGTCSVNGNLVTLAAGGKCTIVADQAGNANFAAALSVSRSFDVGRAAQDIAFGVPPVVGIGSAGTLAATATSGLPVVLGTKSPGLCSVSGSTVSGLALGRCVVVADQAGNGNYLPAPQATVEVAIGDLWWDVFWRRDDGTDAIWQFTGALPSQVVVFFPPGVPLTWHAKAVADVNGDGTPDVIWLDPASGQVAIWLMGSASTIAGASFPASVGAGSGWTLAGAGDVNGDGRADLVWRNTVSGQTLLWLMDAAGSVGPVWDLGNVPLSYALTGIGDFDGDGRADLLWFQASDGQVALWLMGPNGTHTVAFPAAVGPGTWRPYRIGDFDGDGKADVFWRDTATGMTAAWYMNGGVLGGFDFFVSVPVADWDLGTAGDFDLDGRTDLMWFGTATGAVARWLMNGQHVPPTIQTLPAVGTGWSMVP